MANYFYTDAKGNKRGPYNEQDIQIQIDRGLIGKNTPVETDIGNKILVKQIPGLNFRQSELQHIQQSVDVNPIAMSITSWLTDFAFRDLRLPVINLWACKIIYAICCIAAALILPMWIVLAFISLAEVPAALLIVIPFAVICVALFVFAARLACEWYIIVFDWIVETTKAARIYAENNKKEQEK